MAFEDNPSTRHCAKPTLELMGSSDMFPNYEVGQVKAGSVGCGHLNNWLACVVDGVRTEEQSVCELGGTQMSAALLASHDDNLKLALSRGLRWTLVGWRTEVNYPLLPSFAQRALNVEHHVGEGPSVCVLRAM